MLECFCYTKLVTCLFYRFLLNLISEPNGMKVNSVVHLLRLLVTSVSSSSSHSISDLFLLKLKKNFHGNG